jgi:hypothetical protein
MKPLPNEIVLRPRFQLACFESKETVLQKFKNASEPPFLINRLDEHVFIKFNAKNNHFWSPQLHLEIEELTANNCQINAVFGPNPTLWTFFMFIHFVIATLFIIIGIWAYTSAILNKPYHLQISLMVLITVLWFVLYFLGRGGKKKGKPQMHQLHEFTMKVLTK